MPIALIKSNNKLIRIKEGQELTIGRSGLGTDVEINNSSISRRHARLKKEGEKFFLQDTGSLNGILVNQEKIEAHRWIEVMPEDEIKLLTERLYLIITDEEPEIHDSIAEPEKPVSGKQERSSPANEEFHLHEEEKMAPEAKVHEQAFQKEPPSSEIIGLIKKKGKISIGRLPTNDLVLDDPTVSRKHSLVTFSENEFWIEDLHSKNKTYINGKELRSKTRLRESDIVVISFFSFNLQTGLLDLRKQKNAISAVNIRKEYPNGKRGLQDLSIEIANSSFAALMGPSGCGKSTLLKCLNGDNPATRGEVYIHGLSLEKNFNLIKKKIGYVPQEDIIHKELSVYDTLFYAAKIRLPDDTSDQEIENRIDSVINSLHLNQDKKKDIRKIKVADLSGGQRKRISIAVELLTKPSILFLDEPTSPLDPETIESFLKSLQDLAREGTTIIMVTHKPEDLNYVDQVIFLGVQGYLTYKGSAKYLVKHFEADSIVKVYSRMSNLEEVQEYYLKPRQLSYERKKAADFKRDKTDSLRLQLYWLTLRYFKIKTLDKANLLLLVAQPVIIAGLVCLVFDQFRIGVLFLMAISAIWFGVSNAAKEIVSELSVYRRERMYNLNIHTYLLSKILVLSLIALTQTIIFVSIIYFFFKTNPVPDYPDIYLHSYFGSALFMFFISFSATLIGLLLSSFYNTTEKVMTVVPITLMPQILLAGVMTKIDSFLVEFLSFFTLGRWGTEGLARIQDDGGNNIIVPLPANVNTAELSSGIEVGCACLATGALDALGLYENSELTAVFASMEANIIVISVINLALYVLMYYSLRKKDSL